MDTHKIYIYLYRMAKDTVIPSDFDKIHSKYKTTYFSIISLVIITITLIYIKDVLYVSSLSLFADLFYYIIEFFAFIRLRKKQSNLKRKYKSPCGILLAVFCIIVYAIIMTELKKDAFMTGILLCAIGVIVFKNTICSMLFNVFCINKAIFYLIQSNNIWLLKII